jgi:hypothetical protein
MVSRTSRSLSEPLPVSALATSNMGAITENASMQIVEIDGEPATPQDLHRVAVMNYGHFTSMQVREGRVHGFELHLSRLASSSAVLFDHALERERVRVLIRHAWGRVRRRRCG